MHEIAEALYRDHSRRILATLIRPLGDFDLAEEARYDAFRAALKQWLSAGVPANPRAWKAMLQIKKIEIAQLRKAREQR